MLPGIFFVNVAPHAGLKTECKPLGALEKIDIEESLCTGGRTLLTIRLYSNNDAANILWEWAFSTEGLVINSSSDVGSRAKNSFILCDTAAQNRGICTQQQAITAELVLDITPTDTVVWKVEALEGNLDTDDLDSSSNASNKPFAYGKTKDWKIGRYVPNATAPTQSGTGRYQAPWISQSRPFTDAKFFSFMPDMSDEPHTPASYTSGGDAPNSISGTRQTDIWRHNPHVAYKITAIVNGQRTYEATVKMDHQDVIRQEYINHIASVSNNISDIITLPDRDEVKDKATLGSVLTGDWGQSYYDYVFDKHLVLLASRTQTAFQLQAAHTFNVPNAGQDSLPAGGTLVSRLRMNSAWRNPERNERITSNTTSRHMVGRAVDLGSSGVLLYGVDTTNRAKLLWQLWRAIETTSATENGIQIRWILENANGANNSNHGAVDSVFLVQGGTTVRTVPTTLDTTDVRGATEFDGSDGIPDMFNRATHVHFESMPSRGVGL